MPEMQEEILPEPLNSKKESALTRYRHLMLPSVLVLCALCIRLWLIPTYEVISVDGSAYAVSAKRLTSGDFSLLAYYGFYPVLVALAHLIVPDLELAGRLVSAIMGSLLILPVYFLGMTFFDRRAALYSASLIIAWPEMVGASCEVMTQSTFNTLMMIGVLFLWQGFSVKSWRRSLLAGLALGLAYATRTEAIVLVVALCLPPLAAALVRKTDWQVVFGKVICPLFCGLLLILIPNLLLVHEVTGTWQLAAKTSGALRDGLMYYLELAPYELPPELATVNYWDVLRNYPGFIPYSIAKNLTITWQTMLPLSCWILAFIGFCADGWKQQAFIKRLYLAASFTPFLIIIIFYYVGPEYFQPYLPVTFLWIGRGLSTCEDRLLAVKLPQQLKLRLSSAPLSLIIAAALTVGTTYKLVHPRNNPPQTTGELDGRIVQKEYGYMMKKFLPEGKIMTRWARSAFYADREWSEINSRETIPELIATAKKNNIRFLLIDQMSIITCPQTVHLLEPATELLNLPLPQEPQVKYMENINFRIHPELQLYLLYRDQKRVVAAIYQFLPAPK